MMFSITSFGNHSKLDLFPKEEKVDENSLFQDYMNLAIRLGNRISIEPAQFAAASMIVHYAESGLQTTVKGDNHSTGIWQCTKGTRKALKIPEMSNLLRQEQLLYYEKFLLACPKKALLAIRNSVDLHTLHFAPSRTRNQILCEASNHNLKALDRNKDGVITKDDLLLFEEHRIKQSEQITVLYNQFFKNG